MNSVSSCLRWLAAGAVAKALVIWFQELLATRAAAGVQQELRAKLFDSVGKLGPRWLAKRSTAELNLLATTGLDSLEPYFSKYLPQLVYTALVTPTFVVIIWMSDLPSGVTLIITLPLIPLFMILIGWATQAIQGRQLQALTMLSQHFLEVLRGLTTLKIFGRLRTQERTLARVSTEHRLRTMKVLRVSFLSGFALELISSLAVALIAVSIGLRLLGGDLTLGVGLFVLLLAPEAFLPLRQVGAQFHASAEGVAASKGILDIIDEAQRGDSKTINGFGLNPNRFALEFDERSIRKGQFNVITGPSGIGKSTILSKLLAPNAEEIGAENAAWLPQTSKLFGGTIAENIIGPGTFADSETLERSMQLAALDDLTADREVGESGTTLSGGQAQRVCLARTFYRALTKQTKYLLLDEPTSALDEIRAEKVVASLRELVAAGFTVVAISHQETFVGAAQNVIVVRNV